MLNPQQGKGTVRRGSDSAPRSWRASIQAKGTWLPPAQGLAQLLALSCSRGFLLLDRTGLTLSPQLPPCPAERATRGQSGPSLEAWPGMGKREAEGPLILTAERFWPHSRYRTPCQHPRSRR